MNTRSIFHFTWHVYHEHIQRILTITYILHHNLCICFLIYTCYHFAFAFLFVIMCCFVLCVFAIELLHTYIIYEYKYQYAIHISFHIYYVIVNIFNAFPPQKSDTFTNRRVNFTFMYSWCETFTLIHSVSRILCGIHKLQFALLCCVQWYISLSMCCVCFASSFAAATRCVICCFHIWNMFLVCFHHCFTHYWNLMEVNRGTQMLHYIYYFVYI